MKQAGGMTTIYLVCFHSASHERLDGASGQYLVVEQAIGDGEWPYDNGDDPSFYVARRGGFLTWGVCRQDLRNSIARDSIVVFFSFTPLADERILYRLCAVATVADKVDHRALDRDDRFFRSRHRYINGLIVPDRGGWRHDETDRSPAHRHADWLWRLADHRRMTKKKFGAQYAPIYRKDRLSDGTVRFACNYVVFSRGADQTFIAPQPPPVAVAREGQHERWLNTRLRALTLENSTLWGGRSHLRTANRHRPHRQIRFEMPIEEANDWRDSLIAALKNTLKNRSSKNRAARVVEAGTAARFRCG
jgi:hypothetical protein